MLVRIQMGTNTAENQHQHLSLILQRNREFISRVTNNHYNNCLENNNIVTQKLRSSVVLHQKNKNKQTALYLIVKVFSTKVLTGDTSFTSPIGDGTGILRGHLSHAKVQPLAVQREYFHFSVIFKTLSYVLVRPRESNPRPSALQSNALPTELILPRSK